MSDVYLQKLIFGAIYEFFFFQRIFLSITDLTQLVTLGLRERYL